MSDADPCEFCDTPAETVVPSGGYDGVQQRCPRCGEFKLARTAMIRRVPRSDKVKLSGWVRDQNQLGEVPELTSDRISLIAASPLPGIVDRAGRLLTHAVRNQERLGESIVLDDSFIAITYSTGWDELMYLAQFLTDEGLIKLNDHTGKIRINPRGYMRYEALQTQPSASAQAFVAMWFHDSMREDTLKASRWASGKPGTTPCAWTGSSMLERLMTRSLHRSDALAS